MADLVPFVELEFAHALGPAPGRYVVVGDGEEDDVLQIRVLGAPPPRDGWLLRRARRVRDDETPRPTSVLLATLIGAGNRFSTGSEASAFLRSVREEEDRQAMLVDQALDAVNQAIRAFRAAARDPYVAEVARADARAVRIGIGSPEQVAGGRWADAFTPPSPRGPKLSREERLRPSETVALALRAVVPILASEDLALRTMLDLERGRTRAAALQLRACVDLLVAELTDAGTSFAPPRDALLERAPAVERLAQLALDDRLDGDALAELEEHLERVEDALEDWRAWHAAGPAGPEPHATDYADA